MTDARMPNVRVGDIVTIAEQHYRYGVGTLILEIIEVGRRERHSDGTWLNLRGVELSHSGGIRLRQRQVLVRLDGIRTRPGPLTRDRRPDRNAARPGPSADRGD